MGCHLAGMIGHAGLFFGVIVCFQGIQICHERHFGIHHNVAARRQGHHHVRPQRPFSRSFDRLLLKIAIPGHACQLCHLSQSDLPPAAPDMGQAKGLDQVAGFQMQLMLDPSHLGQLFKDRAIGPFSGCFHGLKPCFILVQCLFHRIHGLAKRLPLDGKIFFRLPDIAFEIPVRHLHEPVGMLIQRLIRHLFHPVGSHGPGDADQNGAHQHAQDKPSTQKSQVLQGDHHLCHTGRFLFSRTSAACQVPLLPPDFEIRRIVDMTMPLS